MNLTFSYLRNQEAGIKELYIFNQGSSNHNNELHHAVLFVVGSNSFKGSMAYSSSGRQH